MRLSICQNKKPRAGCLLLVGPRRERKSVHLYRREFLPARGLSPHENFPVLYISHFYCTQTKTSSKVRCYRCCCQCVPPHSKDLSLVVKTCLSLINYRRLEFYFIVWLLSLSLCATKYSAWRLYIKHFGFDFPNTLKMTQWREKKNIWREINYCGNWTRLKSDSFSFLMRNFNSPHTASTAFLRYFGWVTPCK